METSSTIAAQDNKMSHKKLRNHIRKLKRKAKRQLQAKLRDEQDGQEGDNSGTDSSLEELKRNIEAENARNHQLWLEAERLADQKWKWMKAKEERDRQKKLEVEKQIREEWEERMRIEEEEKEKKEKLEKEKKEKQDALLKEATANERKGSEAWHNPLAPVVYGEVKEVQKCPFFAKTATCRFAERCSRRHDYPESSSVILIPGMFTHFELDQGLTDEYESDLILEYEEGEIYNCFQEFYSDVLPELKSVGKVVQFKVCCNYEFHLRGNVYVQFEKEEDALKAYGVFNGRYYAGKQLSCQFVNIPKWRSAICGLFHQRRCPKGKICNFIHAFRNPKNEFWQADKDMEHVPPQRRSHKEYFNNYHHRYPINRQRRRRSYSRERSRSRSRSRYESRRSYSRERSRSRSRSRYESRSRYGERRRQRRDYHSYSHRSRRRSYSSDSSDYSRNRRRRRSYSSDTSQSSSDSHISKNTSRSNHKKYSFDKSKQKHKHHKHNSYSSSNSDISDTEHKKEVQKSHDQTKSNVTDRHDLLDIPLPVSDKDDDSRTVQLDTDVNSERKNNADVCDSKQTATEGNDNTSNVPGETFHREHSSPSSKRRSRSRSRSSHRKHKRSRSRSKKRKHKSKSSKKHKKHSH